MRFSNFELLQCTLHRGIEMNEKTRSEIVQKYLEILLHNHTVSTCNQNRDFPIKLYDG